MQTPARMWASGGQIRLCRGRLPSMNVGFRGTSGLPTGGVLALAGGGRSSGRLAVLGALPEGEECATIEIEGQLSGPSAARRDARSGARHQPRAPTRPRLSRVPKRAQPPRGIRDWHVSVRRKGGHVNRALMDGRVIVVTGAAAGLLPGAMNAARFAICVSVRLDRNDGIPPRPFVTIAVTRAPSGLVWSRFGPTRPLAPAAAKV